MAINPQNANDPLYDLSGGWRAVYAALHVSTEIEPNPDRLAAATQSDRPLRYRRKHAQGVSS